VTRDPAQAIPVSGTWTGAPSDFLGMTVNVEAIPEGWRPAGRDDVRRGCVRAARSSADLHRKADPACIFRS